MKIRNVPNNNHIILIGFKHVGKTLIGRQLAKSIKKRFIDLDKEVEKHYNIENQASLTCRQIMHTEGESRYRELESHALQNILTLQSCVLALGGGTGLSLSNQEIIKKNTLLHVIAPRGIVFERIMVDGRPAFFDPNEEPYESFNRLWNERDQIYKKLTPYTVNNSGTIEQAVNEALLHLNRVISL